MENIIEFIFEAGDTILLFKELTISIQVGY